MKLKPTALMLLFGLIGLLAGTVVLPQAASEPAPHEMSRDTLLAAARAVIDSTPYCMLVTSDDTGTPRVRPMEPFPPEPDMTIWLGTNRYSRKVEDIKHNPKVALSYLMPSGMGYVSVYGTAKLVDEDAAKEKWWKPKWARFYPDKSEFFLPIKVTPERIEVINYQTNNVLGDPKTWTPPSIEF